MAHTNPFKSVSLYFKLILCLIVFFHKVNSSPPYLDTTFCTQDIVPGLATCPLNIIPGVFVNIYNDENNDIFNICKHIVVETATVPSTVCYEMFEGGPFGPFRQLIDCNNVTGTPQYCTDTGSCVSENPHCYCTGYTSAPVYYCNHNYFVEDLHPVFLIDTTLAGVHQYVPITPLSFDLVNTYNLFLKENKEGFDLVLPFFGTYLLHIITPFETIHFNHTGDMLSFHFPVSYRSRSFPFIINAYHDDNLIYSAISETKVKSFCDDPTCLLCQDAFQNFHCLGATRQFVLVFSVIITLLILLVVFFLFISFFLFTFKRCLKPIYCYFKTKFSKKYSMINESSDSLPPPKSSFIPSAFLASVFSKEIKDNDILATHVNNFKKTDDYNFRDTVAVKKFKFNNYLTKHKVYYKEGPNSILSSLLVVICLCLLASGVSAQCSVGGTSTAVVGLCSDIGNSQQQCTVTFSMTASLDRLFTTFCGQVTDQAGAVIGSIRISYFSAVYKLFYNLEYYTSSWTPVEQSNFRCYQAPGSFCDDSHCISPNRTGFGNLDNPFIATTYGQTKCDRVPNGGLGHCILPQFGCLFSGYGVLPSQPLTTIYRQSNIGDVIITFYYESIIYDQREEGFYNVTAGVPLELSQFEIILDSFPQPVPDPEVERVSYPNPKTASVINPLGVYTPQKIGDVQSANPSFVNSPNFYNALQTTPASIVSSSSIQSHSASYQFYTSGVTHNQNSDYKLPKMHNRDYYTVVTDGSSFNYVLVNMTNPAPISLTILGDFQVTRTMSPCTFDIDYISQQGCCDCSTHAFIEYSIVYISQPFCNVIFSSQDVSILTSFNNQQNRIFFDTDDCNEDIIITASSGTYSQSLTISLSLEHPMVSSFSSGVTTVQVISSEDASDEPKGIKPAFSSFFNKFNPKNIFHWAMLIFFVILGIMLILFCFWVFFMLLGCIVSKLLLQKKVY